MKKLFVIAMALLILVSVIVSAQDAGFELEEASDEEFFEEEFVVEEQIVEDKAGLTPDSAFYFVDEVVENVNLAVRSGSDKAEYALKVNEEKVAEAKLMADKNKTKDMETALIKALNVSQMVEADVSPELEELTKEKMETINAILAEMEEQLPADLAMIGELIESQKTQAEKNKIAAETAKKIGALCEKLAMQDYKLMEKEPRCDPENAPEWLREFIEEEINVREQNALEMAIEQMTTCIADPRECDCSMIPVVNHRLECEESNALAIRCEFEEDMEACNELQEMEGPSFEDMPDFMREALESVFEEAIAKKELEMMKKFAPPECIEAGAITKEDCEAIMEEIHGPIPEECMVDGEFIGEEECEELMEGVHGDQEVPEGCMEDGEFIGQEECEALMEGLHGPMPDECIVDGEFIGEEECGEMMEDMYGREEEHETPEECMEDGEFIGRGECEAIMEEISGPMPEEYTPEEFDREGFEDQIEEDLEDIEDLRRELEGLDREREQMDEYFEEEEDFEEHEEEAGEFEDNEEDLAEEFEPEEEPEESEETSGEE